MEATATDAATPINLAQHSYFNLAGHDTGTVQIPTGEILSVADTPAMDFRKSHRIGDRILDVPGVESSKGYDHNYVLFGLGPDAKDKVKHGMAYTTPKLAATLVDEHSGRAMRVYTTAPGVQLYTGNFLDGSVVGKDETAYQQHAGVCLETQAFPNSINQENFPSVVVDKGEKYRHVVEYEFFTTAAAAGGGDT